MALSVLCAVDDSPTATEVIRVGAWLRERLGVRLVIAHVVPDPVTVGVATSPYGYVPQPDPEVDHETAEVRLEAIAHRSAEAEGAELRAVTGDPVETLLSLAEEVEAELLVVGSRGRSAFKAALLGSVSSALTTRASCPVVVVPPTAIDDG